MITEALGISDDALQYFCIMMLGVALSLHLLTHKIGGGK